jgi:hypothetical protein
MKGKIFVHLNFLTVMGIEIIRIVRHNCRIVEYYTVYTISPDGKRLVPLKPTEMANVRVFVRVRPEGCPQQGLQEIDIAGVGACRQRIVDGKRKIA